MRIGKLEVMSFRDALAAMEEQLAANRLGQDLSEFLGWLGRDDVPSEELLARWMGLLEQRRAANQPFYMLVQAFVAGELIPDEVALYNHLPEALHAEAGAWQRVAFAVAAYDHQPGEQALEQLREQARKLGAAHMRLREEMEDLIRRMGEQEAS